MTTETNETELVKATINSLQVIKEYSEDLFDNDASDSRDLILPKILLMQGLSELVSEGKAIMGEMRGSVDGNLLGGRDKPLEVIPFYMSKSWILFAEKDGKLEYSGQVPFGPDNANWQWDAIVDGQKVRRDQSINLYCCLPKEIETGIFMPYLITFRRTSYTAGRKAVTLKEKLRMFKRPLASTTLVVSCKPEKNDKGTFYVWDITQGRNSTEEEMKAVAPWMSMVKQSQVKVDDSDLEKETMKVVSDLPSEDYQF